MDGGWFVEPPIISQKAFARFFFFQRPVLREIGMDRDGKSRNRLVTVLVEIDDQSRDLIWLVLKMAHRNILDYPINIVWLVVWLPWILYFPRNIGLRLSSQLTKSYFSEGWPNHQEISFDLARSQHFFFTADSMTTNILFWLMSWGNQCFGFLAIWCLFCLWVR